MKLLPAHVRGHNMRTKVACLACVCHVSRPACWSPQHRNCKLTTSAVGRASCAALGSHGFIEVASEADRLGHFHVTVFSFAFLG